METKPRQRDGHINARSQDKIRAAIRAEEIVEKLNDHILGSVKLTNTQVRAAEILLRKIQPDLVATHLTTDDGTGVPLLKIVRAAPPEAIEHVAESEPSGADTQDRHALAPSSKVASE